MPQPKKGSSRTAAKPRVPAAKKPRASAANAPRTSAAKAPRAASAKAPRASGAKAPRAAASAPKPRASASSSSAATAAGLATVRDALARGIVLTRERISETLDDAVTRGRMTRADAEELTATLVGIGRRQTQDLLADLEQLLGSRASEATDRIVRRVDRARRAAGIGPSFPILGYDDLTAVQIAERLTDLTPAQLRKVRDYERRNGNRRSVLTAIERALR
jgi:polyhydroxyalkanoate synthesis regulator phasin